MGRLNLQLEPNTKEETMQAMCLLAGNNTHRVVPMLLNKTLPWDRYPSHGPGTQSPAQYTLPCLSPSPAQKSMHWDAFSLTPITLPVCVLWPSLDPENWPFKGPRPD